MRVKKLDMRTKPMLHQQLTATEEALIMTTQRMAVLTGAFVSLVKSLSDEHKLIIPRDEFVAAEDDDVLTFKTEDEHFIVQVVKDVPPVEEQANG